MQIQPRVSTLVLAASVSIAFLVPHFSLGDALYGDTTRMPTGGTRGMMVADDRDAAEWGASILRRGGNAVDAAVATAFGMSVTRPHFASIGGGGFMVFCPAPQAGHAKPCTTLDFRETAPARAQKDMYLRNGKADPHLSQDGALASGVPGNVAGWLYALEHFGTLPRKELLSRPIRWAQNGIRVSTHTERAALDRWNEMNDEAKKIFSCGHPDHPCEVGQTLYQKDLAKTRQAISKDGAKAFYQGSIAQKIAAGIQSSNGILTVSDLNNFKPKERAPLIGKFHDDEVVTMPPPSSGGMVLLQMLAFMDRAKTAQELKNGIGSVNSLNAEAYAMSLAFADRAEHLGDPDFYHVPLSQLLSPSYLDERWKSFDSSKGHVAKGAGLVRAEGSHTTHFSVIDHEGNAVAMTITINDNFGSGFVPPGTGIVMNNEMDDFSAQPGAPNLFGLVGAEANSIHPGKRPLSSMTPSIVRDPNGNVRIVLGAAGGPRIITAVFQTLLNRLEYGLSLVDAVASPRIHHQWKPETVRLEKSGFPFEVSEGLKKLGYTVEPFDHLGVVHALERLPNHRVVGAPDPRGEGAAVAE
jgi:gamma-glutamyltranspeptidase/glutathione hydrolase